MNDHLSCFISVLSLLFLFHTISAFALTPDEYLEETPDFESILSDMPPGFNFSSASEKELRDIPFLDLKDIESIISLRDSISGGEYSREYDEDTKLLSPLVRFLLDFPEETDPAKKGGGNVRVRSGFLLHRDESLNTGRQYMKVTADSRDRFRLSILGEHDPFEPRTLDLASLGISFPVKYLKSEVTLGDFRPGFGMGLLFSRYQEYLMGARPRYYSSATSLNTSFEESRYMRGGMLATRYGPFESCVWTSVRHLDATIENGKVITLNDTGLHLSGSPSGNVNERVTGAHLSLGDKREEISITGALSHYSPGFARMEGERYFGRPEAASFPQFSVAGRTNRGHAEFSFEHARMNGGEHATLAGVTIEAGKAETCILVRDYSSGYWAPRSGAPSAFGNVSNERGIYSSLDVLLPARLYLTASLDIARMLGRSWSYSMPVSRSQFFFSLRKHGIARLDGSVAYRSSDGAESGKRRWSLRGRVETQQTVRRAWGWQGTAVWSAWKGEGGPFAEASLHRMWRSIKINGTLSGFRIPSYFSRYYLYQPDVPGRGVTTGVWGNGCSTAVVCTVGCFSGRIRVTDSDLMPMQREITLQSDFSF